MQETHTSGGICHPFSCWISVIWRAFGCFPCKVSAYSPHPILHTIDWDSIRVKTNVSIVLPIFSIHILTIEDWWYIKGVVKGNIQSFTGSWWYTGSPMLIPFLFLQYRCPVQSGGLHWPPENIISWGTALTLCTTSQDHVYRCFLPSSHFFYNMASIQFVFKTVLSWLVLTWIS